eukprot:6027302-Prymnesium_polylepis.2
MMVRCSAQGSFCEDDTHLYVWCKCCNNVFSCECLERLAKEVESETPPTIRSQLHDPHELWEIVASKAHLADSGAPPRHFKNICSRVGGEIAPCLLEPSARVRSAAHPQPNSQHPAPPAHRFTAASFV